MARRLLSALTAGLLLSATVVEAASPEAASSSSPAAGQMPPPASVAAPDAGSLPPPPTDFDQVKGNLHLFSPEQIRELKRMWEEQERALESRTAPVTPKNDTINVSLEPGANPPEVILDRASVSVLSFYDLTGAPWPIVEHAANEVYYMVKRPLEGGNSITITPNSVAPPGNIVVFLQGEPRPVTLRLRGGADTVHYRLDVRVLSAGPNASLGALATVDPDPVGDAVLTAMLDGVPPDGAEAVETDLAGTRAWRYGGHLYVRTPHVLMSPQPIASESAAGMRAYRTTDMPVLTMSVDKEVRMVRLGNAAM